LVLEATPEHISTWSPAYETALQNDTYVGIQLFLPFYTAARSNLIENLRVINGDVRPEEITMIVQFILNMSDLIELKSQLPILSFAIDDLAYIQSSGMNPKSSATIGSLKKYVGSLLHKKRDTWLKRISEFFSDLPETTTLQDALGKLLIEKGYLEVEDQFDLWLREINNFSVFQGYVRILERNLSSGSQSILFHVGQTHASALAEYLQYKGFRLEPEFSVNSEVLDSVSYHEVSVKQLKVFFNAYVSGIRASKAPETCSNISERYDTSTVDFLESFRIKRPTKFNRKFINGGKKPIRNRGKEE